MGSLNAMSHIDQTAVKALIETFWIVPAGMVALYFYGRSRFNTPNYALGAQEGANLLTLAPPIFTTYRSRFNRFALLYILILEIAFLVIIFLTSVVTDIATIINFKWLSEISTQTIQHRALLALFFLTGLFSSFPGFKDLDAWILRTLHQAALIPEDARQLAKQLYDAPFVPHPEVAKAIKGSLVSRDILRVAEGGASGTFESKVLKALCLLNQLQHKIANSKYNRFKILLEKDLDDIASKRQTLRPIFISFLKEQENIVPVSATDIDQYLFEKQDDVRIAELIKKRNENSEKCGDLLYRLCLVVALLVYATKFTPETVGNALSDLGFNIDVKSRRIMDWDAVLRVTGCVFLIMLGFNALFALLVYIGVIPAPAVRPSRQITLLFTLVGTVLYFVILMVAIKSKKFWHRDPELYRHRPENVLVAIFCYLFTLPILVPLSWWIRGELTYAPFVFAVNQGVIGYFIGVYIDRSLNNQSLDWQLAAWQGLIQAATALATLLLVDPIPGTDGQIQTAVFYAVESGVAGFLIGYLFQQYYRRTRSVPGAVVGDIRLQARPA